MMKSIRRQAIWDKTGGRCAYCGLKLHQDSVKSITSNYQSWMEIDHLTSPKDGGGEELANCVPSCSSCNASKGRKSLEAFRYQCAKRESGRPHIPRDVLDWLQSEGIQLPDLPKYEFWFERLRALEVAA